MTTKSIKHPYNASLTPQLKEYIGAQEATSVSDVIRMSAQLFVIS
jgi:hypothetical protein